MNDRELLELAAKAAGYDVKPHGNAKYSKDLHFIYKSRNWNPLTDDGDALRLAVKLNLKVMIRLLGAGVCSQDGKVNVSEYGEDPYAATRRAIVLAAAEIGKDMK